MPAPATLTPEENAWLAILAKTVRLAELSDQEVRAELTAGGFPEHLIEAFLRSRRPA